ncbi:MAG: hypothetical protein Q4C95_11410 [Planctomycetia bacterium]|nr:hypothetical protein [Planctomycetia bacterium]
MGLLDKVFGGKKGVVNVLAKQFGGTIRVIFVNGINYNESTHTETESLSYSVVSFLPSKKKSQYAESQLPNADSNGLLNRPETCSGTVPACQLYKEPKAGQDRFEYRGSVFRIDTVDKSFVGDTLTEYQISGTKIK